MLSQEELLYMRMKVFDLLIDHLGMKMHHFYLDVCKMSFDKPLTQGHL